MTRLIRKTFGDFPLVGVLLPIGEILRNRLYRHPGGLTLSRDGMLRLFVKMSSRPKQKSRLSLLC